MIRLNLPETLEGSFASPRSLSYLHNMYNLGGILVQRSALSRACTSVTQNEPRALMTSDPTVANIYAIHGREIYDLTLAFFSGTDYPQPMTGNLNKTSGPIGWAAGFTGIAIADGSKKYFLDTTSNSYAELTTTVLPSCTSVQYLDGRYIWLADHTGDNLIYFSEVNDAGNVDPQSFLDAEARIDRTLEISVIGNDLYALGSTSIERFRNIGPPDAPLVRVNNSIINIGYIGGIIRLSTRIVFVGVEGGGSVGIFELSGGSIRKISNPTVNEFLNSNAARRSDGPASTGFGFDEIQSQSFSEYGYNVMTFRIRTDNSITCFYAIDNGSGGYNWGFISDNQPDNSNFKEWGIHDLSVEDVDYSRDFSFKFCVRHNDTWLFLRDVSLSNRAGLYFKEERNRTLYGDRRAQTGLTVFEPISRGVRMALPDPYDMTDQLASLRVLHTKQGMLRTSNDAVPTGGDETDEISIRLSKTGVGWGYGVSLINGRDWSDPISLPFGNLGDNDKIEFRNVGGLLQGDGYASLIIESSSDCTLTIEGLIANA